MIAQYFTYSEEVQDALFDGLPIVVLESTVITHGMPYPQNVETAKMLEEICRDNGVTPATIALYDGQIHIGLDSDILEEIAKDDQVEKVSVRDIAYCLANKLTGGTTVAATSKLAKLAGLKVFATGGIGGIHRGYDNSLDASADLVSLKENNVIVVSAGAKAILDLPKTLEVLESYNVPVLGYKTKSFPAFYTRQTELAVRRVDSVDLIAEIYRTQESLDLDSGILVANPIPVENEIPSEIIDPFIKEALIDADRDGITGKDITPYLLSKLYEITKGKSLDSNIELIKNNVILACEIAKKI